MVQFVCFMAIQDQQFFTHETEGAADTEDIFDPTVQRRRLFEQDPRLVQAVSFLCMKIKSCPVDSRYPGHTPRALVVGGFVRDALAGHKPTDADVEVYGMGSDTLEQLLDQLFPGKVDKVGKAFGILSVSVGHGLDFDVSLPRRDSQVGPEHNAVEVDGDPTMTIREAAQRRDFTMNSLAADMLTGELFDYFGGLDDVQKKILRVTDEKCFQEDALRVYRGLQFTSRLDLVVDPKTFDLMEEMVTRGALDALKPDRVTKELEKLLTKSRQPSRGIRLADELGMITTYYPQFAALQETDAWEMWLVQLDRAAGAVHEWPQPLSDLEKAQVMFTTFVRGLDPRWATGATWFSGTPDEREVQKVVEKFCGQFKLHQKNMVAVMGKSVFYGARVRNFLSDFCAPTLSTEEKENSARIFMKKIYPVSPEVLLVVSRSMAGVTATDGEELFRELLAIHPEWLADPKNNLLVQGRDVVAQGLKPGPKFTKLITMIEDARDRGEIKTRNEAIVLLETLIKAM